MLIIETISFLITLLAMPFVTRGTPLLVKCIYLGLCCCFTPIIGIPLYKHLMK